MEGNDIRRQQDSANNDVFELLIFILLKIIIVRKFDR